MKLIKANRVIEIIENNIHYIITEEHEFIAYFDNQRQKI